MVEMVVIAGLLLIVIMGGAVWLFLRREMQKILQMNQVLLLQSKHLEKALSGDIKTQGYWGEMVLERVLESSGLRVGEDYILQGKGLGLRQEEGGLLKPDVVVMLPDNRHLIIDAKVSLTAYMEYLQEEEQAKEQALKRFLQSIKKHIHDLGERDYDKASALMSPECVFLFLPIESAYALAIQKDKTLQEYAWAKGVVVVTASTLMITLKTVASLWRLEQQNKNAEEIAKEGSLLYNKVVSVMDDLERIELCLGRSQEAYRSLMQKLRDGRGSVLSRTERLRTLGVSVKKTLEHFGG
jgi:DNA recombination protein RmuC